MKILNWAEEKIKKLNIWNFAIVKTALVTFGVIIGAYISTFVKQYILYFIAALVTLYAIVIYNIFKKK